MAKKNSSALGSVKKITFGVLLMIALILISFIILHNVDKHRGMNDKIIVNIFGKQRMYSQQVSKDASTLYTLLLEKETGMTDLSENELNQQIADIKNEMETAREEFASTLEDIHAKKLQYASYKVRVNSSVIENSDYLKKIDALWVDFDKAIQAVVASNKTDLDMHEAVDYINDKNMSLLNLSDLLLEELLNASLRMDQITEYVEYGLIVLIFGLISYYLYNLVRFIILPYNQLYKGITEIGLSSYPVKSHFPTRKRVMPMVAEINDMFLKINYLISLIGNINNNNSFMETLTYINKTFSVFIPYNYIGIALMSEDKRILKASYGVSDGTIAGLPETIIGMDWPVSDTSLGYYLETGEARIINDLEEYCKGRPVKLYNQIVLEASIRSSIALPLKVSGEPVGMIFFSSRYKNVYNDHHLNILQTLANSIAISLNKNIFASEMQYSSVLALAKLSEARDEDTGEHMERMAKYAKTIAVLLHRKGLYPEEITVEYIDLIERFSPLHDIGKVGISDKILLKPAKLTPEEFDEMKQHTIFGAQVLRSADMNMGRKGKSLFGMGVEIAEGHHEKWDGSGYPNGKKGLEIPLSARITAVADVFDALTSKRPYKEAFSLDKSFAIVQEGRGTHFDPVIVDLFLENRERMEEIYYNFNPKQEETA